MQKSVFAVMVLLAAGCGDKDAVDSAALANGEMLYTTRCASCHGAEGRGEAETGVAEAADLTAESSELSDEEFLGVIADGATGMPGGLVSGSDADDVLAYVRSAFGG